MKKAFFDSLVWLPNIKVMNTAKLVQLIFSAGFGCSEYVGYLTPSIILTVLS